MLWLALCFAVGILLASFTPTFGAYFLLACSLVFGASALVVRAMSVATILLLIAFAAAGSLSFHLEAERNNAPSRIKNLYDSGIVRTGDPVEIDGVLTANPEPSIDGVFLTLKADNLRYHGQDIAASGNVGLFAPQPAGLNSPSVAEFQVTELKYGSRIRVPAKLERDDEFLNPGVIPHKEVLDRLGLDATGSVKSSMLVERIADESVVLPLAWIQNARSSLIGELNSHLDPRTAGVLIASALGDKHFLDKGTADIFREGGTFHILVISGLHITFIGGILILIVGQFTQNRWAKFLVTIFILWAYALAVGAEVPVVRAVIMFTFVSYSYVHYRRSSVLNSLGIVGLILLVWRPSDLFNPSFQLTFVSVAAIAGFAVPMIANLQKIGNWTPTANAPFPPNVPRWLKRSCETLYWREDAWQVEQGRQLWSANILKVPYLRRRIAGGVRSIMRYMFEAMLVSVVVLIWMLPFLVVYFHRVSIAAVLLNIWVGIFVAIESFAAALGVLSSYFSNILASGFYAFADVLNNLMLWSSRLLVENGWANFRLPAYSGRGYLIYIIYFLPLLLVAVVTFRWDPFALGARNRRIARRYLVPAASALTLLMGVVVFHPFSADRADGRMHIDFLDVGQGDSALITFPDGRTMLVDAGGRISYQAKSGDDPEPFERDTRGIGEAVVSEFLWHQGRANLDYILATHADADHIQGFDDVAKNFRISSALFGRTPQNDPEFAALAAVLQREKVPIEVISRGDVLEIGGVSVEVLSPLFSDDANATSANDDSVVLRLTFGRRVFLLTGDIESGGESFLTRSGDTLAADLIKVAHHGSRTSSAKDFVNTVGAKYAVISVGRSSPFGHPHPEVVERWKNSGAKVIATGERGTISVSTDGSDLTIDTFQK